MQLKPKQADFKWLEKIQWQMRCRNPSRKNTCPDDNPRGARGENLTPRAPTGLKFLPRLPRPIKQNTPRSTRIPKWEAVILKRLKTE